MTPPTLAARLQAALAQAVQAALAPGQGSKSWDRAGVEELLVTIGRDAAASGTRMADIAIAFLESIDSIDSDNSVGSPPGSRLAGLLRSLLGAYEAAREGRRGTGESNDSVARLLRVQEEERRRLAAEIHDSPIQSVAAASMRVQLLARKLPSRADWEPYEALERTLQHSAQHLRRLTFELQPLALDDTLLAGALRAYLGQAELEPQVAVHLVDGLATQPPEPGRLVLYRAAQEAVTNVARHAAASVVTVALSEDADGFSLLVDDDGCGFRSRPGQRGLGLTFLRERAEAVGGSCRVESWLGRGTSVQVWVPRGGSRGAARAARG